MGVWVRASSRSRMQFVRSNHGNRILQNFPAHPPAVNPRLSPSSSSPLESRPSTPGSFTHLVPAQQALWRFLLARCCDLWVLRPRRRLTRVNCRQKPEYLKPRQLTLRATTWATTTAKGGTTSRPIVNTSSYTRAIALEEATLLPRSTKRASNLQCYIPPFQS